MQWRSGGPNIDMIIRTVLLFTLVTINVCDGARRTRTSQRRKDTHRTQEMYTPTPSAESLQAIAEAMGAAGFEHYTEGRPLVKRLIPVEDQADLDLVEFQGVIGKAGVDFPAYPTIPSTGFNCKNVPTGYYADLETDCQVFHICDTSRKISFLCPNGTIFSQSHLICDWWFKVDCASAPALYESSAEYYSNEQKKTHKITQSLSKVQDFIPDSNVRAESRRATVNVPSTTERLLRHRQKLQTDTPLNLNGRVTPRTLHALLDYSPTQRTQITTAFENRKRNLVQLISNNFGNAQKTTSPTYDASTHRPQVEVNGLKEMQVAAETASFAANNNNRQFLQEYNKNYRPYPVYSPNTPKPKSKTSPNLTTLYDIRDKPSTPTLPESTTTKRPTLVPYTKAYTIHNHRDPYTRPGVSLLRNFVQQERNRTQTTTTEKVVAVTQRSDNPDRFRDKRVTIESKDTYESVTKIPHTTLAQKYFTETGPDDRYDGQASTHYVAELTTEPSYKERRERLLKKLNLDNFETTEPTDALTTTEKSYGDLPNRPGLVVPPSLTPKTLHSLAIYYATALDNLSTVQPEDGETTTPSFEDYIENMENLPGLFSQQTINKYGNLFGQGTENPELLEEIKADPNGTYNELNDDLSVQQSQNPIATSPQIRELAQVFTHALSAYLQDPVQFRKVLSDIRPTQPSFGDLLTTTEDPLSTEPTTTVNEEDDEILGFSDDHKEGSVLSALREPKALSLATDYPTAVDDYTYTTAKPITEYISTTYRSTTPRVPFKCCGRISASYITPSSPFASSTTPTPITNTVALNINTLSTNSETISTESSYVQHRFGGFQNNAVNNDSPYGNGIESTNSKPLSEYIEATNLPTAWGIDNAVTASTTAPVSIEEFESKKISTTSQPTTVPVYFTETENVESENEEELQRAHSQSFIAPQGNSLRQGKQLHTEDTKTTIKKPSEELEAPTFSDVTTTVQTTTEPSTTVKITETETPTSTTPVPSSIFTSPDSEKSTFIWTSNFDNWHSTVIDPITLNDGLSPTGLEEVSEVARQENAYIPSTATTADYTATTEQAVSSTARFEVYTPTEKTEVRSGRLLKDITSTEPAQDLSTITDTVVEKAKEIMGGMNATTTEKLMNVMKKTKSKTVRRLILLLVQTCDDDHNTTAEASKRALLEALMAVSQKDMDEIAKEEGVTDNTPSDIEVTKIEANRRTDRQEVRRQDRRGKSINFDPSAINSLSSLPPTESVKTTQDLEPVSSTQSPKSTSLRGLKKFHSKTDQNNKTEGPIAEARVAPQGELKPASDTRALELLRSLYTIAARWG